MEEINLKELFDYIKERILIVAIILLAVLVVGCIYSIFLKTPMYKSNTTIVLVSDDGNASGNTSYTQNEVKFNQSLVPTYSDIIKSRRVIENVIKNLSLDYTYATLQSRITVTNTTNTEIIKISVSDSDKALAADIANEIVKVFSEEIKEIYRLQNVSIVDKAVEANGAYNINIIKDLIIYILVGIVLGLGTIFVVYYFDTTIKSAEMIENKLGLPVYGVVPRAKHRENKR